MADVESAAALLVVYASIKLAEKKRRKRRIWVKPWLAERAIKGAYTNLVNDLHLHDHEEYRQYIRMSTNWLYYTAVFTAVLSSGASGTL